MMIRVRVPGSCGELVQGIYKGTPFLLTCPVPLFSTAVVSSIAAPTCLPPKAEEARDVALAYMGCCHFPYQVQLTSEIPKGKGMASSTADVTAVLQAVACACGRTLTEEEVGNLAARIDPVDGVFASGLALMAYKEGTILRTYDPVPPIWIAILDAGGMVDTQAFHAQWDPKLPQQTPEAVKAITLLGEGLTEVALGQAATWSALAHQRILPKPSFTRLLTSSQALGALGVNAAHSGTVCGVLFSSRFSARDIEEKLVQLMAENPDYTYIKTVRLISGAMQIERKE